MAPTCFPRIERWLDNGTEGVGVTVSSGNNKSGQVVDMRRFSGYAMWQIFVTNTAGSGSVAVKIYGSNELNADGTLKNAISPVTLYTSSGNITTYVSEHFGLATGSARAFFAYMQIVAEYVSGTSADIRVLGFHQDWV